MFNGRCDWITDLRLELKFSEERRGQQKIRKEEGRGSGFRKGAGRGEEVGEAARTPRGVWTHDAKRVGRKTESRGVKTLELSHPAAEASGQPVCARRGWASDRGSRRSKEGEASGTTGHPWGLHRDEGKARE